MSEKIILKRTVKNILAGLFGFFLFFPITIFAQGCITPGWYAGNSSAIYGSAAAACAAFDMSSIGYPDHSFTGMDGAQKCVHVNSLGNELQLVNAGMRCAHISPNTGNGPNNTCNPINIATGNKFFSSSENGSVIPLSRFYNTDTGLWRFSYFQQLIIGIDSVIAQRPDDKAIKFVIDGDLFISPSQAVERLEFNESTYTLFLHDNVKETYDSYGRLLSINKLQSDPITVSYSANKLTVTQSDNFLELTKDLNGQVVEAVSSDGNIVNYDFTIANGERLFTVTYSDGLTRKYLHEDARFPTYITGIIDENGDRMSTVQYDNQARAISSVKGPLNSGVERTQIQYNTNGTRTLTNALGKQSTYHFIQFNDEYKMTQVEGHPSNNCASANKNYTYYPSGLLHTKTDWRNNVTRYQYNSRNLETQRLEAKGTTEEKIITTEWHPTLNLPTKITEPKRETIIQYDAQGREVSRVVSLR